MSLYVVMLPLIAPLFCFSCGMFSFVSKRKHLLNVLLSLEFMMLGLFWFMIFIIGTCGVDGYFVLFFLTLAACEGALGLSLLVNIVRMNGNDNFGEFSMLSC